MELSQMSENVKKMIEKQKSLVSRNTEAESKKRVFESKVSDNTKRAAEYAEKLKSGGIDVNDDPMGQLEKEYQEISTIYMEAVRTVQDNEKILEEIESKLG